MICEGQRRGFGSENVCRTVGVKGGEKGIAFITDAEDEEKRGRRKRQNGRRYREFVVPDGNESRLHRLG